MHAIKSWVKNHCRSAANTFRRVSVTPKTKAAASAPILTAVHPGQNSPLHVSQDLPSKPSPSRPVADAVYFAEISEDKHRDTITMKYSGEHSVTLRKKWVSPTGNMYADFEDSYEPGQYMESLLCMFLNPNVNPAEMIGMKLPVSGQDLDCLERLSRHVCGNSDLKVPQWKGSNLSVEDLFRGLEAASALGLGYDELAVHCSLLLSNLPESEFYGFFGLGHSNSQTRSDFFKESQAALAIQSLAPDMCLEFPSFQHFKFAVDKGGLANMLLGPTDAFEDFFLECVKAKDLRLTQALMGMAKSKISGTWCMFAGIQNAAKAGHVKMVEFLVDTFPTSKKLMPKNWDDIHRAAVEGGDIGILEYLLKKWNADRPALEAKTKYHFRDDSFKYHGSALIKAAEKNRVDMLQILYDQGIISGIRFVKSNAVNAALEKALELGHDAAAEFLRGRPEQPFLGDAF